MTYKEAFCADERYVRASWINIAYIIFHELTGINVILLYSNTILEQILGTDTDGFNARQGTYVINIVNTLSTVFGIYCVRTWSRKGLLLYGHTGIAIAHLLIAIFIIIDFNAGVLTMICVFMFIYASSSGPVAWLYAAETCCDVSLGVAL